MVDGFQDFGDFLTLGVEEFMKGKDTRGYFRSAGIGVESEDKGYETDAEEDD